MDLDLVLISFVFAGTINCCAPLRAPAVGKVGRELLCRLCGGQGLDGSVNPALSLIEYEMDCNSSLAILMSSSEIGSVARRASDVCASCAGKAEEGPLV